MDSFLGFWLLVIVVIIVLVLGLIFLSYWIPKRYGQKKLGIGLAIFVSLIFITPILSFVFEDYLFFKSDVSESLNKHGINSSKTLEEEQKRTLKNHQIELQDQFEILSNEISGILDFYHKFEIKISKKDKSRLTNWILASDHYVKDVQKDYDIRFDKPRYSNTKVEYFVTYQTDKKFVYEYYKPNARGIKPTWNIISIPKGENKLIYEEILD